MEFSPGKVLSSFAWYHLKFSVLTLPVPVHVHLGIPKPHNTVLDEECPTQGASWKFRADIWNLVDVSRQILMSCDGHDSMDFHDH